MPIRAILDKAFAGESMSSEEGYLLIHCEDSEIDSLIERRTAARRDRDFLEADRIRAELESAGVVLEDTSSGTKWRRAV